ncbi:sperm acrosome membrane-associated protein 4-like, partial [Clarias magur]
MKCVLLGIAVVIGLFAIAESLTCNKCPASLFGLCFISTTTTCTTNTSVCTTSKA